MQNKNYRNDNVYRGVLSCTITDLSVEAKKKKAQSVQEDRNKTAYKINIDNNIVLIF
jgi:hypothetical protein